MLESKKMFKAIIKDKDEQIEELENVLKAVICKYSDNQIEVTKSDIEKAKTGELYKETSYLKLANTYKVIFKKNFVIKRSE